MQGTLHDPIHLIGEARKFGAHDGQPCFAQLIVDGAETARQKAAASSGKYDPRITLVAPGHRINLDEFAEARSKFRNVALLISLVTPPVDIDDPTGAAGIFALSG